MVAKKANRRTAAPVTGELSPEAQTLLDNFAKHLNGLDYKENSITIYRQNISRFIRLIEQDTQKPFDPCAVTPQQIRQQIVAKISQRQYSPLTAKGEVKAIRQFFAWLHDNDIIPSNPAAKLTAPPGHAKEPAPDKKDVPVHLAMTQQLYDNLIAITPPGKTIQDTIRSACREKLDRRADVVGSKRHFTGQFREEMEELRATTEYMMIGQTMLLAEIGSMLLLATGTIPEEDWSRYDTNSLLEAFQDLVINYGDSTRIAFLSAINRARTSANMAANNPALEEETE